MVVREWNGGRPRQETKWGDMSNPFHRLVERLAKWFGFGEHESDISDRSELLDIISFGLAGIAVGMTVSTVISVWTATGRMSYETFMILLEASAVESSVLVLAAILTKVWALNIRDSSKD